MLDDAHHLAQPTVAASSAGDRCRIALAGDWTTDTTATSAARLAAVDPGGHAAAEIDLGGVGRMDTNGAWTILRTANALRERGLDVAFIGVQPGHQTLIEAVRRAAHPHERLARPHGFTVMLIRLGKATFEFGARARDLLDFLGAIVVVLAGSLLRPWRVRRPALVHQMEHAGLNALPIVGLLAFLIGVVTAYQGADQLAKFGAQIYTVNVVGLGVLREMGVLITAIIVAGRSGSAFTAQIGTMKVNQEIDALETLGLDPMQVLVLPRVLGLMLVMPLLVFYADIMGLIGGAMMASAALDISFAQFLRQLNAAVPIQHFWVGMAKAPLFAFVIAMVGCFEGFKVSQSAESVGQMTTKSVVESVFLVIVLDALLSIFFSVIGV